MLQSCTGSLPGRHGGSQCPFSNEGAPGRWWFGTGINDAFDNNTPLGMNQPELLKIENLEICFQRKGRAAVTVVRGFNLSLFPGESLALVGESGCGKTTVALALPRLIAAPGQIANGRILFAGEDLLQAAEQRLRQIRWREIALIFQDPAAALNPLRRVGSQVAEVLRLHLGLGRKVARQRTLALFEAASLPEVERCYAAYPHELSSGMRQRALIAMAMACRPRLIIADEPTTALDAATRDEVLACLLRLQQELGISLLFISHDLALVANFCDRLAIMHAGGIVECGETGQILRAPQHAQTRQLLAAAQRFAPPRLHSSPALMDGKAIGGDTIVSERVIR